MRRRDGVDRRGSEAGDHPVSRLHETTAAAMRALSGCADLSLRPGDGHPSLSGTQARLPARMLAQGNRASAALRGEADSLALRHRHHDLQVHLRSAPRGRQAREVFDVLERIRIEALGARRYAGVARNLQEAAWARWHESGLAHAPDAPDLPMHVAVSMFARRCILGEEYPPGARALMCRWESLLGGCAASFVAALEETLDDQRAYARVCIRLLAALEIADGTREAIESSGAGEPDAIREHDCGTDVAPIDVTVRDAPGNLDGGIETPTAGVDDDVAEVQAGRASIRAVPKQRSNPGAGEGGFRYRSWTSAFDETVEPASICDAAELAFLRRRLDADVAPLACAVHRLAMRLQRTLLARMSRAWDHELDEGILDTGHLARVITTQHSARAYKRECAARMPDTVVALLIDNSGSMRGRSIELAAITADILARTLERCAIKVEILGFTTASWKGGRAREHWLACGRPPSPGRLADLRHIVYKRADSPWRQARIGLGLMLHPGLLKENVDGEALTWAYERLLARPEPRRILLVLSDGAPADDSTLSANDAGYLDRHLRQVIREIERRGVVELTAVGIRHDVAKYYSRAITVMDAGELGSVTIDRLAHLFDARPLFARSVPAPSMQAP